MYTYSRPNPAANRSRARAPPSVFQTADAKTALLWSIYLSVLRNQRNAASAGQSTSSAGPSTGSTVNKENLPPFAAALLADPLTQASLAAFFSSLPLSPQTIDALIKERARLDSQPPASTRRTAWRPEQGQNEDPFSVFPLLDADIQRGLIAADRDPLLCQLKQIYPIGWSDMVPPILFTDYTNPRASTTVAPPKQPWYGQFEVRLNTAEEDAVFAEFIDVDMI